MKDYSIMYLAYAYDSETIIASGADSSYGAVGWGSAVEYFLLESLALGASGDVLHAVCSSRLPVSHQVTSTYSHPPWIPRYPVST